MMSRLPLLLFALLAATPAFAETVYRCGPNGTEYSATPCASGRALQLDDSRTPSQQRDAEAVARQDAQLAERMTRERKAREATATRAAARIGPAPASTPSAAPHGKKKKKKKAKPDRNSDLTPPLHGSGG